MGRVCNVCPYFLETSETYRARSLDDMDEHLKIPTNKQQYDAELAAYEAEKNNTGGKKVKIARKLPEQIDATASETMTYRTFLGYLWPVKLYTDLKKKRPSPRDITAHNVSGKKVRGVLLGEEHGRPMGVVEVFSDSSSGVLKRAAVVNDDGDGSGDEFWKAAQKRNRVSASSAVGRDGKPKEARCLKKGCENGGDAGDSSDPDALMDAVWGGPRFTSKPGFDDDDEETQEGGDDAGKQRAAAGAKRRRRQSTRKNTEPQPGATNPPTPNPSPQKPPRQQLELNKSEQVLLASEQLVTSMNDNNVVATITVASMKRSASQVESRLSPDIQKMYSADFNCTVNTRGMTILDKLLKMQRVLSPAVQLIECLQATGGDNFCAAALKAALRATREVAPVAEKVDEVLVIRFISETAQAQRYEDWASLLKPEKSDTEHGIHCLQPDAARAVQTGCISRALVECLRAPTTPEESEAAKMSCVALLASLQGVTILADDLQRDLKHLTDLFGAFQVDPNQDGVDEAFAKSQRAKEELVKNKSSLFFKPMTMFIAGTHILADLAKIYDKREACKLSEMDLRALQEALPISRLQSVGAKDCMPDNSGGVPGTGFVVVPYLAEFRTLHEKLAHIKATSPCEFRAKRAEDLAGLDKARADLVTSMCAAGEALFFGQLTRASNDLLTFLTKEPCNPPDMNLPNTDGLSARLVATGADLGVDAFLPTDLVAMFDNRVARLLKLQQTLAEASTWFLAAVVGQDVRVFDSSLQQFLMEWQSVPEVCCEGGLFPEMLKLHAGLVSVAAKMAGKHATTTINSFSMFVCKLNIDSTPSAVLFKENFVGALVDDGAQWADIQKDSIRLLSVYSLLGRDYQCIALPNQLPNATSATISVSCRLVCVAPFLCHLGQIYIFASGYKFDGADFKGFAAFCDEARSQLPKAQAVVQGVEGFVDAKMPKQEKITGHISFAVGGIAQWVDLGSKVGNVEAARVFSDLHRLAHHAGFDGMKGHIDNGAWDANSADILEVVSSSACTELYDAIKAYEALQVNVASLTGVIHDFADALDKHPDAPKQLQAAVGKLATDMDSPENKATLLQAGFLMGNMTALQSLLRPLKVGESRNSLTRKFEKMLDRKAWMTVSPNLLAAIKGHSK